MLIGRYRAAGVQVYTCATKDGALAWTFSGPEAELSSMDGRPFAHHSAGPTWQAVDGSKVVGRLLASAPSPRPGAVPWLLLSTTATGTGVLSGARFVQRIDTVGGVGPTGSCTAGSGARRVPYRATYVFYR